MSQYMLDEEQPIPVLTDSTVCPAAAYRFTLWAERQREHLLLHFTPSSASESVMTAELLSRQEGVVAKSGPFGV